MNNNAGEIFTEIPGAQPIGLVAYYDKFLWYYPKCEPETKAWFSRHIEKDWVILDIGANIGYYSVLFSRSATAGTVYAFEPTSTYEKLLLNLQHNQCTNVKPLKMAVGDKTGLLSDGIFRIWGTPAESADYLFTTVDEFIRENRIDRVDAIKIDVDSFDFEVLLGAEETILRFDPYIMVEVNDGALSKRGFSAQDILQWAIKKGYSVASIYDKENYLLKREAAIRLPGDTMNVPLVQEGTKVVPTPIKSNITTAIEAAQALNRMGSRGMELDAFSKSIPVVDVDDLHTVLDFENSIGYPAQYKQLPLQDWRMEINDSPIFRYLYRNVAPKRHLEFGTWQGAGAVYCLEESEATVWTINLPFGEPHPNDAAQSSYHSGESFDLKLSSLAEWAKRIGFPQLRAYNSDSLGFIGRFYIEKGLSHRVCQIYADSTKWDTKNYPDGFFDSILVDGGHTREILCHDTLNSLRLLRPGGLMMWHDCCPPIWEKFPGTTDVLKGIQLLTPVLQREFAMMFWVKPSWILVGIKKP